MTRARARLRPVTLPLLVGIVVLTSLSVEAVRGVVTRSTRAAVTRDTLVLAKQVAATLADSTLAEPTRTARLEALARARRDALLHAEQAPRTWTLAAALVRTATFALCVGAVFLALGQRWRSAPLSVRPRRGEGASSDAPPTKR
jgi:hypothetical protein